MPYSHKTPITLTSDNTRSVSCAILTQYTPITLTRDNTRSVSCTVLSTYLAGAISINSSHRDGSVTTACHKRPVQWARRDFRRAHCTGGPGWEGLPCANLHSKQPAPSFRFQADYSGCNSDVWRTYTQCEVATLST